MTAQAEERTRDTENWVYKEFVLTGVKAWKGASLFRFIAGASAGKVTDTPAANTVYVGTCWRTADATAADAIVTIRLPRELQQLEWFLNGDAIAATDVGKLCFAADDQTVQKAPIAGYAFGKIWAVDSSLGVLVEKLQPNPTPVGTLPAFAVADSAPTSIAHKAIRSEE